MYGDDSKLEAMRRMTTYRGLREIHGLEQHGHGRRHLDDLAAHQTQLLVVVQYRVHVLDPHRVDRAVERHPLPVRCVGRRELAERVRNDAIRPLDKRTMSH